MTKVVESSILRTQRNKKYNYFYFIGDGSSNKSMERV